MEQEEDSKSHTVNFLTRFPHNKIFVAKQSFSLLNLRFKYQLFWKYVFVGGKQTALQSFAKKKTAFLTILRQILFIF